MANFRYSDSFPYSAEHVTYSGVPTSEIGGFVVRVTVLREDSVLFQSRVTTLKEDSVVLAQKTVVLKEQVKLLPSFISVFVIFEVSTKNLNAQVTTLRKDTSDIGQRVIVRQEKVILLPASVDVVLDYATKVLISRVTIFREDSFVLKLRLYVVTLIGIEKGTGTSNLKKLPSQPIRVRKTKEYRLVKVEGYLPIQGSVLSRVRGFIWAFGSVLNSLNGVAKTEGSVVESLSGYVTVLTETARKEKILVGVRGEIALTGESVLKRQASLNCTGVVTEIINGNIELTGRKDLMPVLVALDMAGFDMSSI